MRYVFFCITLFYYCSSLPAIAQVSPEERAALVSFYHGTNGSKWYSSQNWLEGDPCEDEWKGIFCNDAKNKVTGISLIQNNLSGSLPKEIGILSNLTLLQLTGNRIGGIIPKEIGRLGSLKIIDLVFNRLIGSIPDELWRLPALSEVYLGGNGLSGSIPYEIIYTLDKLGLTYNCNLYSQDPAVQQFIVDKDHTIDSYEAFLNTQGRSCPIYPIITIYLLN